MKLRIPNCKPDSPAFCSSWLLRPACTGRSETPKTLILSGSSGRVRERNRGRSKRMILASEGDSWAPQSPTKTAGGFRCYLRRLQDSGAVVSSRALRWANQQTKLQEVALNPGTSLSDAERGGRPRTAALHPRTTLGGSSNKSPAVRKSITTADLLGPVGL